MVRIMWTMSTWNSSRFGHLVPMVDRDHSLPIIDANLCPVGYVESVPTFAEIDLTEEDNGSWREREHAVHINVDLSKDGHCSKE